MANFGRSKNDFKKQRKVADEYTRLRGFTNGGDRKSDVQSGHLKLTLDQIAQELGTSKGSLRRMLRIERDLTEEMKQYKDEDSVIKDLLETNVRQRGDVGGSAKKAKGGIQW